MTVELRPATIEDASTVADLHVRSWRGAYVDLMPAWYLAGPVEEDRRRLWTGRLATPGFHTTLAVSAGVPVGFCCLNPDGPGIMLNNIHVVPERYGLGVGRRLFGYARAWAGARELHLWVFTANARAIGFYERMGGRRGTTRTESFGDPPFELDEVSYHWTTRDRKSVV